jgi:ribose 5-phosphate isomerase A
LSLPIDLTIDGADEIDPQLQLIKGAGGALLFEKLVAQRSQQLIIIADPAKQVQVLGEKRLLPIEIVRFAAQHTLARIAMLPGIRTAALRQASQGIYITDGGNYILDVQLQPGVPAQPLHNLLKSLTGVIETGLFCTEASSALIGQGDGSVTQLCKAAAAHS